MAFFIFDILNLISLLIFWRGRFTNTGEGKIQELIDANVDPPKCIEDPEERKKWAGNGFEWI